MEYQENYNTNIELNLTASERSFLNRWSGDLHRISSLANVVLGKEARAILISELNQTVSEISSKEGSEVKLIE